MAGTAGEDVRNACRTNGWGQRNRRRAQLHWNARHMLDVFTDLTRE